jgi:hypothetical protein
LQEEKDAKRHLFSEGQKTAVAAAYTGPKSEGREELSGSITSDELANETIVDG